MRFVFIVFLFFCFGELQAQNLVPNSGFEEFRGRDVSKWEQPGSPYYHFEADSKNTHTGRGRNGLCLWINEPSEFMSVKLISPLKKGATYKVEIFALYDEAMHKLANLKYLKTGFLFSTKPLDASYKQIIYENPQANINLEKKTEWIRYESTFIADGEEEYMMIGYFHNKTNSTDSAALENPEKSSDEKVIMEKVDVLQNQKDAEIKEVTEKYLSQYPELKVFYDIIGITDKRKREKEYKKHYEKTQPSLNKMNREINSVRNKYDSEIRILYMQYNPQEQARFSNSWNRGRFYFDDIIVEETETVIQDQNTETIDTIDTIQSDKTTEETVVADSVPDQFANAKEGAVIILNNVYFETNKSVLLPESYEELDRLVFLMESNINIEIEISGHTDNTGSEKKNKILSEARAKAVTDYVVARGIFPDRIKFVGHSSNMPIDTNETENGRAKNRRVECKIIKI